VEDAEIEGEQPQDQRDERDPDDDVD